MIEVPCPKRECKESVLRRNITEHLSECMFEDVRCKYANIGCKEKVIRRDLHQLEKHEEESQQHLQLAIDVVQQQQRAISDMTAQIQFLQKKQLPSTKFMYKFTDFDCHRREDASFIGKFYCIPGDIVVEIKPNGNEEDRGYRTHVSVGAHFSWLHWAFTAIVTIELLNQLEDKTHHSKTDRVADVDRDLIEHPRFISHSDLNYNEAKNCQYLKDDCLCFRFTVETELCED